MSERKYFHTIGELVDLLSISLMKSIRIDREMYRELMKLLLNDISRYPPPTALAKYTYAVVVLTLTNSFIWDNEGDIRTTPMTEGTPDGYKDIAQRLIATHSINGVRTRAKNEINRIFGERVDGKIDCLAADLPPHLGNWRVFDDG